MVQVAFATSDGIHIDRHFGMAERFDIYDLDFEQGTSSFVRTIHTEKGCPGHTHNAGGLEAAAERLKGCAAVVSAAAGPGAVQILNAHFIRSVEAEKEVQAAIRDFLRNKDFMTDYA